MKITNVCENQKQMQTSHRPTGELFSFVKARTVPSLYHKPKGGNIGSCGRKDLAQDVNGRSMCRLANDARGVSLGMRELVMNATHSR